MSSDPQPRPFPAFEVTVRAAPAVTAALLWVMRAPGEAAPSGWQNFLAPWLTGALVAAVAAGLGEFLLLRLRLEPPGRRQRVAYAVGLGLGALSFLVMGLTLCHVLSPGSITLLLMASAVLCPPRRSSVALWQGVRGVIAHPPDTAGVAIPLGALLLMALTFLVLGLVPPFDTDSLRYHLRLPELYLQAHTFVYPERNHFAQFPLGAEMLYAVGLAYAGGPGANMVKVVAGLACLLGIYSLAARRFSSPAGLFAAAVFATTPLVGCLFGATTTDLFVCLYVVLGVGAVMNGETANDARGPGNGTSPWLLVAGVCGGLAATAKLGGATAAGLMAVWAALSGPRSFSAVLGRFLTVGVAAGLVVAPWLVKTWVVTGNPIFPFLTGVLGGRDWRPEYTALYSAEVRSYGHMGGGLVTYLLSPVWLATRWQDYGTPAPLGPLPLALLAALPLLGRRGRPAWPVVAWCAGFFALWLLTAQVARFVLPGLAVLAIALGFVVVELGRPFAAGKPSVPVALALPLIAMVIWTWHWQWKAYDPYLYLTGRITQDEYLAGHASYYPVALYANRSLPPDSRVLAVGVTLSYGFRVPVVVETGFAGVTAVNLANETRSAAELAQALRARGFTHLIVDNRAEDTGWARKLRYFAWRDEAARQRFQDLLHHQCRALYCYESTALYQIGEPAAAVP